MVTPLDATARVQGTHPEVRAKDHVYHVLLRARDA